MKKQKKYVLLNYVNIFLDHFVIFYGCYVIMDVKPIIIISYLSIFIDVCVYLLDSIFSCIDFTIFERRFPFTTTDEKYSIIYIISKSSTILNGRGRSGRIPILGSPYKIEIHIT